MPCPAATVRRHPTRIPMTTTMALIELSEHCAGAWSTTSSPFFIKKSYSIMQLLHENTDTNDQHGVLDNSVGFHPTLRFHCRNRLPRLGKVGRTPLIHG